MCYGKSNTPCNGRTEGLLCLSEAEAEKINTTMVTSTLTVTGISMEQSFRFEKRRVSFASWVSLSAGF